MTYVVFQWSNKHSNGVGSAYLDMQILTKSHIAEAERKIKTLKSSWSENVLITFWKELEE